MRRRMRAHPGTHHAEQAEQQSIEICGVRKWLGGAARTVFCGSMSRRRSRSRSASPSAERSAMKCERSDTSCRRMADGGLGGRRMSYVLRKTT